MEENNPDRSIGPFVDNSKIEQPKLSISTAEYMLQIPPANKNKAAAL